jgi:hypothetical protein
MDLPAGSRATRTALNLFFLYIGAMTLVQGLAAARISRDWIISDWLINYQGGFVRRGLPGETAFLLARQFHVSPVYIVVFFYLSLYAVFLLAFRRLVLATSLNLWVLALVVSPAILSFHILHLGYRKEILFLAIFSVFLELLGRGKLSPAASVLYLTIAAVACVLSHEGLIFYLPYFAVALLLSGRPLAEALKQSLLPLAAGAAAFAASLYHLGNAEIAGQICSSLGYPLRVVPGSMEICAGGAIPYLATTRAAAARETIQKIIHYQYLWIFPFYASLAFAPAIAESATLARASMRREMRILWVGFAVTFLCTLVLFLNAIDWGRWIYIHIASMSMLLFFADARHQASLTVEERTERQAPLKKLIPAAALFAYATLWIMPNSDDRLRLGYVGHVLEKVHILHKPDSDTRQPVP